MVETQPEISLSHFAGMLRRGEVVAFPTETVYGLGADAWNADAVAGIFTLKGRPPDNPLIVHVADVETVELFAAEISDDARLLMEQFWPGPLALVFRKRPEVLDIVTAGLDTVAVRMPDHPVPLRLISEAGPIAAPSANTSGRPSPTRADHVRQDFRDEVSIIDGGSCQYGIESTVLDLTRKPYTILRPGGITQSDLEQVLRQPVRIHRQDDETTSEELPRSPGMKYTHYAPDARIRWMTASEITGAKPLSPETLYLLHRSDDYQVPGHSGEVSKTVVHYRGDSEMTVHPGEDSEKGGHYRGDIETAVHYHGDYREMARDLYDRFRMADLKGFREVAIEPFSTYQEDTEALLNRIRKAIGD